jgi:uncharacterized protein
MEYLVVCVVAVLMSALTLFSGFGLGMVLMPAFALFFPVPVAIAAAAVVNLANNGARLIKKVTLRLLQIIVGIMLVLVGFGMAGGLF